MNFTSVQLYTFWAVTVSLNKPWNVNQVEDLYRQWISDSVQKTLHHYDHYSSVCQQDMEVNLFERTCFLFSLMAFTFWYKVQIVNGKKSGWWWKLLFQNVGAPAGKWCKPTNCNEGKSRGVCTRWLQSVLWNCGKGISPRGLPFQILCLNYSSKMRLIIHPTIPLTGHDGIVMTSCAYIREVLCPGHRIS